MSSTDAQIEPTSNDQPPANGTAVAHPTEQLLGDDPPNNYSVKFETDAFEEQQEGSKLISKAQSFLESPELQEKDSESKTQYLKTKGISEETVDELQQAVSLSPAGHPVRRYVTRAKSYLRSQLFHRERTQKHWCHLLGHAYSTTYSPSITSSHMLLEPLPSYH